MDSFPKIELGRHVPGLYCFSLVLPEASLSMGTAIPMGIAVPIGMAVPMGTSPGMGKTMDSGLAGRSGRSGRSGLSGLSGRGGGTLELEALGGGRGISSGATE